MNYPSIVANLFDTGLHRVVFRTPPDIHGARRRTMDVTAADFADGAAVEAMVDRTKDLGSQGTLVGERFSLDLLRLVCRHGSNPFKLAGFESYEPTYADMAIIAHGTIDGERAVWDQLVAPNLDRFGISADPGVVTRNAPAGLGVQPPTAEQAEKHLSEAALYALKALGGLGAVLPSGQPLTESETWKNLVAPLLVGPIMSP